MALIYFPQKMTKEELQEAHKLIGRAKYHYYEKHTSIMSDYEFDKLERKYNKYCEIHNAPKERRWSEIVGFSWDVPLVLFSPKELNKS